jgi:hypothetical protein
MKLLDLDQYVGLPPSLLWEDRDNRWFMPMFDMRHNINRLSIAPFRSFTGFTDWHDLIRILEE